MPRSDAVLLGGQSKLRSAPQVSCLGLRAGLELDVSTSSPCDDSSWLRRAQVLYEGAGRAGATGTAVGIRPRWCADGGGATATGTWMREAAARRGRVIDRRASRPCPASWLREPAIVLAIWIIIYRGGSICRIATPTTQVARSRAIEDSRIHWGSSPNDPECCSRQYAHEEHQAPPRERG